MMRAPSASTAAAFGRRFVTLASVVGIVSSASGCSTAPNEPSREPAAVASTSQAFETCTSGSCDTANVCSECVRDASVALGGYKYCTATGTLKVPCTPPPLPALGETCTSAVEGKLTTTRCCYPKPEGKQCHVEITEGDVAPPAPPANTTNVARGKVATQSSTYDAESGAQRAVDGNTAGHFHDDRTVTQTTNEMSPWWRVDLGADHVIDSIAVWNRSDCCGERLAGAVVEVLDARGVVVAAHKLSKPASVQHAPGAAPLSVRRERTRFTSPVVGYSVRVQLRRAGALSLAEVEVFGRMAQPTSVASTPPSSTYDGGAATLVVDGTTGGRFDPAAPSTPPASTATKNGVVTTSSSYEGSAWSRANVIDGTTTSLSGTTMGFSSQLGLPTDHTEWIELKLPEARSFSKVVLYPRSDGANTGDGFPVDFKIQVWDGAKWLDRVIRTDHEKPTAKPQTFTWGYTDKTDGIRIEATKLRAIGKHYYLQLAEIEVLP